MNHFHFKCPHSLILFTFQSFHLQPTGTPGTYYLQTTSNQGLPLSLSTSQGLPLGLANNSTVTLTTGSSPSLHEHIILHSLSVSFFDEALKLRCSDQTLHSRVRFPSPDGRPLLRRRRHHPDSHL